MQLHQDISFNEVVHYSSTAQDKVAFPSKLFSTVVTKGNHHCQTAANM